VDSRLNMFRATAICLLFPFLCNADEAPKRDRKWAILERAEISITVFREVKLRCNAEGGHEIDLWISFPSANVARIRGEVVGDFDGNAGPRVTSAVSEKSGQIEIRPSIADGSAAAIRIVKKHPENGIRFDLIGSAGSVILENMSIACDVSGGDNGKPEGWRVEFPSRAGEAYYGFGERFDAVNQRGRMVKLWGTDAGLGSFVGTRDTAYKNSPFFLSSSRFAFFWDSSYRMDCDMARTTKDCVSIIADGPVLDLYFLTHTNPKDSLRFLSDITGKPLLPPRWAFEPWMGGEAGRWISKGEIKSDIKSEMLRVIARFRELDIPHSAIFSCAAVFKNMELLKAISAAGVKPLCWYGPNPDTGAIKAAGGGERKDYERVLLHMRDGSLFAVPQTLFLQGEPYFDFTHPDTINYVRLEWRERLQNGLAGAMVDDGDDSAVDALYHNGETGRRMHNRFHYLYHKTFSDVFREARGDDFFLFARSAGPGCQQFVCFFAGDHPEAFDGLQSVIRGGLTFSASGFPFWGSDIGGLLARPLQPLTEPVYLRWVAFAAFSPIMRSHGCSPREPWRFGNRAVEIYKYYAWLRMNLLPTTWSLAIEAHKTGVPIMRIPYLEFPEDEKCRDVEDGYCFGPDLWFAPVSHDMATSRVYLPGKGIWTDLRTGEKLPGGDRIERPTPLGSEPILIRESGILLAELESATMEWGASMSKGKRLCIAASANGKGNHRKFNMSRDRAFEVTSITGADSWRIRLSDAPEDVSGFVVYGSEPRMILFDGAELMRTDAPPDGDANGIWWYDAATRSVKARVQPSRWGELVLWFP